MKDNRHIKVAKEILAGLSLPEIVALEEFFDRKILWRDGLNPIGIKIETKGKKCSTRKIRQKSK